MTLRDARPAIITLLTDFGRRDAYVGIMKGVILGLNPAVRLVDLSHEAPPQDVVTGALMLQAAWRYFPPGTIHLAVVDPGVGSSRRALAAAGGGQFLVGPDNGLFSLVWAEQTDTKIVRLENPEYFLPEVSATFHGRDRFAPVAAHLSLGVPLSAFGPAITDPVSLDFPAPVFGEAAVTGQIIASDHFGNLISNIRMAALHAWLRGRPASLRVKERRIEILGATCSEAPVGALLGLGGSHGYLEIACRQGSAAGVLGAEMGDRIQITV